MSTRGLFMGIAILSSRFRTSETLFLFAVRLHGIPAFRSCSAAFFLPQKAYYCIACVACGVCEASSAVSPLSPDMACSSGQVTIETILDNARSDKIRPQVVSCQLGRLRSLPRKAWGILNKWALEILAERGTVDIPNFVRVGWQRFRAMDGEVRVMLPHCPTYGRNCCRSIKL